ncbi:hypothetical protein FOXYSP1_20498 [Fusarium oxysporum f. sp. phaseoli]
MDYASVVWSHARNERALSWFNRAQKIGARAITGAFRTVATAVMEAEANIQTVCERHAQAGTRMYINIKTVPKTHPLAALKVSASRRYTSPLKKLALAYEGSGTERMETIEAYAVPPWHNRVPLVCEADRGAAKIAAKNVNDIVIATSASDRGGLVGMGGIVAQRSPGQTDRIVARYSATLGSRDDQNPYTAELEALAMALRCMPDGLQCRELTVLSSSQSSLKAIARPQQQSGQISIRQIYEHIERLRKGNNRVKMIWVPSRCDDLSMSREAKRQAKKATRAGCTPQSLPYQAHSTRLRLAVSQLHQQRKLPNNVGNYSKRIDRALPGKHTQALYDICKRREAGVLSQLRTGMARINSHLNKIGAAESDMCECGCGPETMEHFLFRCTRWEAEREAMRRVGQNMMGNLSFFLGGKSASDGAKWRPNLEAVRATVKFAMAPSFVITLSWHTNVKKVALSTPAAMASSSTIPPAALDPFDLGIHTPINLNRGARAALLQNSPVVVNGTIGVSPAPGRMAQTPSSPLNAAATTTATEGAERASPVSTFEQRPISIVESANDLAREHTEEHNTKLMVFRAFCTKFEEAAQQFVTGPQRRFAQQFANDFLGFWKRELSCSGPVTPKPTYSSVAAAAPPTDHDRLTYRQQQQHKGRQTDPPHRQGQQTTIAPPRQDLRVFIRLEAGAPARAHSSYAIRTLIREKLGAVSDKIRQVFQVRSGWAVLAADSATRDFLVEKQAEWAAELGATAVETNKEWFTYVVSDVPTRLSDFYGNEVDSDSVVSDEIEIQTGLKPIDVRTGRQFSDNPLTKALLVSFLKPTKRFWSLFGSSAARLVDKTDRPRQWPLVRRHTDNDTKNHSRDRIRKPSRAWLSDKTRMSHHKNDRTLVLQAQLYQEHLRASWWPRPLMLAMKQRKNPNSPDQAHRESAE